MKKFTKILIAAGIIGAAKYVYDHVEIKCDKVKETKDIDKETIDILREELKNGRITYKQYADFFGIPEIKLSKSENKFQKEFYKMYAEAVKDNINKYINNKGFCDHIYYDNPYNINKIHLDKDGCPMIFEFLTKEDRDMAFNRLSYMIDCLGDDKGIKLGLDDIFDILGLIIDDYSGHKNDFVCWTLSDFEKANEENALPNVINFGEFERVIR